MICKLLIHDLLVDLIAHAVNGRLVRVGIRIKHGFVLVIPVDKVHIVLACWIEFDRAVLTTVLLDPGIRLFELSLFLQDRLSCKRIHNILEFARF